MAGVTSERFSQLTFKQGTNRAREALYINFTTKETDENDGTVTNVNGTCERLPDGQYRGTITQEQRNGNSSTMTSLEFTTEKIQLFLQTAIPISYDQKKISKGSLLVKTDGNKTRHEEYENGITYQIDSNGKRIEIEPENPKEQAGIFVGSSPPLAAAIIPPAPLSPLRPVV